MTRETARIKVEQLDYYLSHTCQDYGERDHEAMMMAIKALEQEPCEDCLSRKALYSALYERFHDEDASNITNVKLGVVRDFVKNFPSVTPQPRKGLLSIDDVMAVFDDFMCGEVDEDGTNIFLEMLRDKADMREAEE